MFVRIKETVAEKLRGLCAGLSPEKRMLTVIVLAVLFALGNFYLIFRAIYDIGREDVQRDIIEIAPLDIPDIVPADTLPDKRVQEMEEFLTDSIRKKMSNDINKLKQRLEIRKYLVFAGMFLLFLGAMWFIFAPSEEDKQKEEKNAGFNTELPDPRGAGIEEDKIAAYEQADIKRKQAEKMRTLGDFSGVADENSGAVVALSSDADTKDGSPRASDSRNEARSSSVSAYNNINRTLGNFYESPQEDPEKEALKAEVEQLKQTVAAQNAQPGYEEQVALLEKSYELAAKYMPGNGGKRMDSRPEDEEAGRDGNMKAVPVGLVSTPVVSSLPQPVRDSVSLTGRTLAERFHTPIGHRNEKDVRNTICACIHGNQTVISGQGVRMRLLEAMRVGKHVLPKNSLLIGEGRIQGERLHVNILQVEYGGTIIPVKLAVYDNDGQEGIFIPGSMEANAVKEVAANLGQNLGTSISITNQSAGDQLLSELGKGAIQGVSQYISRKMREEKVHLKSGYTLMLYQNDNQ